MKYRSSDHPKVNQLTDNIRDSFYYSCVSNQINLIFNGSVHKQFSGIYKDLVDLCEHEVEVKVLLYHSLLSYKRQTKGFTVCLRVEEFTKIKQTTKHKVCSYRKFTSVLSTLVSNGYGTLYVGDRTVDPTSYKSVFVMSDKFINLFSGKNKNFFPTITNSIPYDDLVLVMSEKDKKGNRTRLQGIRGTRPLKNTAKKINDFLAKFEFRDGNGNRFYPEVYRSFIGGLFNYGRWYFSVQNMKSSARSGITIDGETVSEWDFSSNHSRICACLCGVVLEDTFKPYNISEKGLVTKVPEDGSERDVYKMGMMCLLNCKGNHSTALKNAWTKDLHGYEGKENSKYIIRGLKETNHEYMTEIKKQDAGSLQYIDSCIMEETMLYLVDREIPFLPYHDSILVTSSCTVAEDALRYAWEKVLGTKNNCVIDKKF